VRLRASARARLHDAPSCRYSDYYISGCKLFAKDVSASILMNYVACGRPFPVTQLPGDPLPLTGKPCNEQSPCCGGAGRHDSHYVCVKLQGPPPGQFLPCPAREQPDYDEIVTYNPDAVLPMAAFEFKRRRRTLLWVDDHPEHNYDMLRTFPGCPQQSTALQVQAYPMRQHCATCRHPLTMDPNPFGTANERKKAVEEAKENLDRARGTAKEREKAVKEAEANLDRAQYDYARGNHACARVQLQECADALRLAESALAAAQAAATAVFGEFAGRDISMEEQTDVLLFSSVLDVTRFLCAHPELSK
jgi:hypothetical protein